MNSHVCSASPALSSSLLQLGPTSGVRLILTSAGNASGWKTSKSYILHVVGPLLALTWQAGYSRVAATAHRLQLGIMKQSTDSCSNLLHLHCDQGCGAESISWTNWSCNIMYLHSRVMYSVSWVIYSWPMHFWAIYFWAMYFWVIFSWAMYSCTRLNNRGANRFVQLPVGRRRINLMFCPTLSNTAHCTSHISFRNNLLQVWWWQSSWCCHQEIWECWHIMTNDNKMFTTE